MERAVPGIGVVRADVCYNTVSSYDEAPLTSPEMAERSSVAGLRASYYYEWTPPARAETARVQNLVAE